MILELVEFNSPPGWDRAAVLADARRVVPRWRANRELLRKHFLLSMDGKTGGGVYIWPSIEAAQHVHNDEWRAAVIERTGAPPSIRYFDLLLRIDNEHGTVTEWPNSARARPVAV